MLPLTSLLILMAFLGGAPGLLTGLCLPNRTLAGRGRYDRQLTAVAGLGAALLLTAVLTGGPFSADLGIAVLFLTAVATYQLGTALAPATAGLRPGEGFSGRLR